MFSRINLFKIIRDHFKTLRNINSHSDSITMQDILLFFGVPIIVCICLMWFKIDIKDNVSNFITVIAILCGFLFNLLAVVYGLMDKLKADVKTDTNDVRTFLIKYIHSNISFDILLSIIVLLFLLVYSCLPKTPSAIFNRIILSISYFLLVQFFLTLLMILNRVYILMKKEN